ncbi:MAG: hydantoinase/oxoprolinase family protein [Thermomicrobiales bacterium]
MAFRAGVDIGGTFTDLVLIDDEGAIRVDKVPSTPPNFARGVMDGLAKTEVSVPDLAYFCHGTTAATNAIIEKKGAATGLITTAGFRDVLEIRRADRGSLYDYWWRPPAPLVPRELRREVRERIAFDGKVLEPLQEEDVTRAVAFLRGRGIEAIAICFLNSFTNPDHELRTKELVQAQWPEVFVCTSAEVLPELLEFERTSTTVANAYVGPVISRYLADLEERMRGAGFRSDVFIMGSSGGMMTSQQAAVLPVATAVSGLAAGVMAGATIAEQAGIDNLITLDVGGTSSDIALIHNHVPRMSTEWLIEFGVPIRLPAVDVHTLGAGGGSIAWIDRGGLLQVGPHSAGALPGPVCYGKGGTEPTTTDAQLVLGRLNVDLWRERYGWDLDREAAERALQERIAGPLGLSLVDAADAVLRVTVNNLVQGIRLVSIERGYDPRTFALCPFGGAGPMYAVDIARELSIPELVIPLHPGVTSALGLLQVDLKHDLMRSALMVEGAIDLSRLEALYADLEQEAGELLDHANVSATKRRLMRSADVRYFGQSKYITVPVENGPVDAALVARMLETFSREHEREYGYTMPPHNARVEIANVRLAAVGAVDRPRIAVASPQGHDAAPRSERSVHFSGHDYLPTPIYWRDDLPGGQVIVGPAIVEQLDSTTVLPPGWQAMLDNVGNLRLRAVEA